MVDAILVAVWAEARVGMLVGCVALALHERRVQRFRVRSPAWKQPDFAACRAAQKADDDLELAKRCGAQRATTCPGYGIRQYRSSSDDPLPPISKLQFAKCMHVKIGLFDSDKPRLGIQPAHSSRFSINAVARFDGGADLQGEEHGRLGLRAALQARDRGLSRQLFREAALTIDLPRGAQIGKPTVTRASLAIGQRATVYVFSLPGPEHGRAADLRVRVDLRPAGSGVDFHSTPSNIGAAFPLTSAVVLTRRMVQSSRHRRSLTSR